MRRDGRRIWAAADGTIAVQRPGDTETDSLGRFDGTSRAPRTAILAALLIGGSVPGERDDSTLSPPSGGKTGIEVDDGDGGGVAGGVAVEGVGNLSPKLGPEISKG